MNVQKKNKEKGFTIIEVVLVLAIAGLIFLMVFIALPALQRSQRDTQRKQELGKVLTQLNQYQSNNRNSIPASDKWDEFARDYMRAGSDKFEDPSQGPYSFSYKGTDHTTPTTLGSVIFVHTSATCSGESVESAGSNKVAFTLKLEGGGVACQSN